MATRFYLPSAGTPPVGVTPTPDTGWEDTTGFSILPTSITKLGSAMADASFGDNNNADRDCMVRQYISAPIGSQVIASGQTIKYQIRAQMNTADGDGIFTAIGIRVVSGDGTVVRGTILAVTRDGTLMTKTPTAATNRQFTASSSEVTALAGDRIVIEIGGGGDPSGGNDHDFLLRIGDGAASDLLENDTTTTDLNPWVEFPNDIVFEIKRVFIISQEICCRNHIKVKTNITFEEQNEKT